jgi:hypothetical protein
MAIRGDICIRGEVMVKDKKDFKYYQCVMVQMREDMCKVHFKGWKKSRDEWISFGDDRIHGDPGEESFGGPLSAQSSVASFVTSLVAYGEGSISAADVQRRVSLEGGPTSMPM